MITLCLLGIPIRESIRRTFTALVPSGASVGDYEAHELRDEDKQQYGGNSVHKAVNNVEKVIGPALIKQQFNVGEDLEKIDDFMIVLDGTKSKSKLGANAILGKIPLYEFLRNRAKTAGPYVLPTPFFNVLNGGKHSGNSMAFQEFMLAPVGANSITDAVRVGSEVYQALKDVITKKFGSSAASEFYKSGKYDLGFKTEEPEPLSSESLQELYRSLLDKYPIILLEDPFAEDDWESWRSFNRDCPVELVGDDLLATNVERIELARDREACNSLLLKINQIGTITESIIAAQKAYSYGWRVFVSHRSGETTDDFIADLVVALSTGHIKSGSPCRGERVAKYNRLMDIEDELARSQQQHTYAGAGQGSI
ncbi:enolase 2 [Uncinocarpus reesii 1704]|uniref:Enolase n=1 Tax=Uncinocarpus reesii (strain UAMH 1704) TaxID=336963 RepID=C4JIL9_UNCRE|nr:enolase 2 [Uncinocarpus reesii 1704]EEP78031.1 enolase 2 [Uncinocarpus reesii 1704]